MPTEAAFALELLALAAGVGLLSRAGETVIYARALVKTAGYFITVAAAATVLCTAYYAFLYPYGEDYEYYYEWPLAEAAPEEPAAAAFRRTPAGRF